MPRKLIGLSLSFCVGAILRNEVQIEEVVAIQSATKAPTLRDFLFVCNRYADNYSDWRKSPERAKEIALHFWEAGLIDQPRCRNEEHFGMNPSYEKELMRWFIEPESFKAHGGVLPEREAHYVED